MGPGMGLGPGSWLWALGPGSGFLRGGAWVLGGGAESRHTKTFKLQTFKTLRPETLKLQSLKLQSLKLPSFKLQTLKLQTLKTLKLQTLKLQTLKCQTLKLQTFKLSKHELKKQIWGVGGDDPPHYMHQLFGGGGPWGLYLVSLFLEQSLSQSGAKQPVQSVDLNVALLLDALPSILHILPGTKTTHFSTIPIQKVVKINAESFPGIKVDLRGVGGLGKGGGFESTKNQKNTKHPNNQTLKL